MRRRSLLRSFSHMDAPHITPVFRLHVEGPASPASQPVRLAGDASVVTKPRPPVDVPPLALSVDQAAAALGLSPNTFRRYVLPYVRSVKLGQVRTVPVADLGKWLHLNAGFADDD
jgi:hypothetical protein